MFARRGIGLIVVTSGTSDTRVPNFFLGRPTGALAFAAFLGLSLFFGFAVTIVFY
jgi:hypothetical protein